MDFLRAQREKRFAFVIRDPNPVGDVNDIWRPLAQIATIGIFLLLVGTVLFFSRPLLLPISASAIIATTLAPLVKRAGQMGIPAGLMACLIVGAVIADAHFYGRQALAKGCFDCLAYHPRSIVGRDRHRYACLRHH